MIRSARSPTQATIGDKLKVARHDRRLSLEESAWRTRMRPDLLRALEGDAYEGLGHESFVRSHLTSYARFLGIDPAELVQAFDASRDQPAPSAIEELDKAVRSARKPPRARWLLASVLSLIVLVSAAVAGILGGQAERPPADLAGAAVPLDRSVTQDRGGRAADARVRLRVEALADTQVSIFADGVEVFEGVLAAGQVRTFRAREVLDIVAADGGTILLGLNGDTLGIAGAAGSVYRARFGPDGIADSAG